ncbi:family 16 glycosylhydrolase [Modestobacter sp. I12A-02628]|uniref:Glycoside hydrolase family 16 protein n=1 Tax=Goekera deserti TaxID=2497753 RepID=A0A7K3WGP3_9ACTN|nr:glycoside hydrolase family 16 protein [Goekera deserti]MPQ97916.1 family 16 glycosylhydrolase [Goekera deserti]NDI48562.1 family 16 glycosylhydrolase [Goekera deserti]NEL55059.1 glycoside hydrolase family 16 protein [Goekera deserti]
MTPSRILLAAAVVVVSVVGGAVVYVATRSDAAVVTATSTATGYSAGDLTDASVGGDGSRPEVAWRSAGETTGVALTMTWDEPTTVDRVRLVGSGVADTSMTSATLTFSDGSSLLLSPDERGDVSVDFTPRSTSSAVLRVAGAPEGAREVALGAWRIDATGDASVARWADRAAQQVDVDTTSDPDAAQALVDGDLAGGDAGATWTAATGDDEPSIGLRWDSPRELSSVVVLGGLQSVVDPGYTAAAPLFGTVVFDDGSRVAVTGISGADGEATTVAFTPRVTRGLTLELRRTIPGATLGVREIAAYDRGTTPPRWGSADGPTYAVAPPSPAECAAAPAAAADLALVCPETGAQVDGDAVLTVQTGAGVELTARTWVPFTADGGAVHTVATATAGADGLAVLRFSTRELPRGPVTVEIRRDDAPADRARLHAQLFNTVGVDVDRSGHAPAGLTLQWDEEFTDPLSVSQSGAGSTYAAIKPTYWGGTDFGDAVFADPAWGEDTLATLDSDYLRIRAEPIGARTDPYGQGRQHLGGLLSSMRVDGSGFTAQYGYFEARVLGAPGVGSWPAFWMLDSESATKRTTEQAEVDAFELYGHDTSASCHSLINWNTEQDDPSIGCLTPNGATDWALSWHTYGVRIVPGGAEYFIDGRQVVEWDGLLNSERPFYFMLNLALGGGWPVDLTPTSGVTDMYVDWVRAYT